ncbi:hypothetical protein QTN25_000600 [Entamoeba marina]
MLTIPTFSGISWTSENILYCNNPSKVYSPPHHIISKYPIKLGGNIQIPNPLIQLNISHPQFPLLFEMNYTPTTQNFKLTSCAHNYSITSYIQTQQKKKAQQQTKIGMECTTVMNNYVIGLKSTLQYDTTLKQALKNVDGYSKEYFDVLLSKRIQTGLPTTLILYCKNNARYSGLMAHIDLLPKLQFAYDLQWITYGKNTSRHPKITCGVKSVTPYLTLFASFNNKKELLMKAERNIGKHIRVNWNATINGLQLHNITQSIGLVAEI